MNRLVLIDGNAILYRAFFALPDTMTLKDGTPINAVFGFTSMLLRIIENLKPKYLICSFDLPKPTFRDKIYQDYRAQRTPTPDDLIVQIPLVKSVVRAMDIPIYEVEGFEADDVIGTLAFQATSLEVSSKKLEVRSKIHNNNRTIEQSNNETFETIIVTGDRDLLQLVNGSTKVYMPIKGLTKAKMFGIEDVEEKYGIHPEQMVDYKAIMGDPSDNYPGVRGIGPKGAECLINEYGDLESVYKAIDGGEFSLSDKIKNALMTYKEDALMAKKLAKIVTDVPLELNIGEAVLERMDTLDVRDAFDKMQFRTLWRRVKDLYQENKRTREHEDKKSRIKRITKSQNESGAEEVDQLKIL